MGLLYMVASGCLLNMFVLLKRGSAPFISMILTMLVHVSNHFAWVHFRGKLYSWSHYNIIALEDAKEMIFRSYDKSKGVNRFVWHRPLVYGQGKTCLSLYNYRSARKRLRVRVFLSRVAHTLTWNWFPLFQHISHLILLLFVTHYFQLGGIKWEE